MTVDELHQRLEAAGLQSAESPTSDGDILLHIRGTPAQWAALLTAPRQQGAMDGPRNPEWDYNADNPADCLRAAAAMIKSAAGLCGSACGALMDCDEPGVGLYRAQLQRWREALNGFAAKLERGQTP